MLNLLHLQFNILLVFFAFSCSGFSVFPQRGAAAEGPGSPQLRVPAFRSDKLRPLCFWRFNGFWQQLLTLLLFRSRKESTTKHLLEVAGQGAAFQSKLLNETHTWTYPEPPRSMTKPPPQRHASFHTRPALLTFARSATLGRAAIIVFSCCAPSAHLLSSGPPNASPAGSHGGGVNSPSDYFNIF